MPGQLLWTSSPTTVSVSALSWPTFFFHPDMAPLALSKCCSNGPESSGPTDPGYYIEFNYDYLDDTFTDYAELRKPSKPKELPEKSPPRGDQPVYSVDNTWIKENHPLTLSVSYLFSMSDSSLNSAWIQWFHASYLAIQRVLAGNKKSHASHLGIQCVLAGNKELHASYLAIQNDLVGNKKSHASYLAIQNNLVQNKKSLASYLAIQNVLARNKKPYASYLAIQNDLALNKKSFASYSAIQSVLAGNKKSHASHLAIQCFSLKLKKPCLILWHSKFIAWNWEWRNCLSPSGDCSEPTQVGFCSLLLLPVPVVLLVVPVYFDGLHADGTKALWTWWGWWSHKGKVKHIMVLSFKDMMDNGTHDLFSLSELWTMQPAQMDGSNQVMRKLPRTSSGYWQQLASLLRYVWYCVVII